MKDEQIKESIWILGEAVLTRNPSAARALVEESRLALSREAQAKNTTKKKAAAGPKAERGE